MLILASNLARSRNEARAVFIKPPTGIKFDLVDITSNQLLVVANYIVVDRDIKQTENGICFK